MTVEILIGRGWRVWIDGYSPGRSFEIGEEETPRGPRYTFTGCVTYSDNKVIDWVEFDSRPEEWSIDYDGVVLGTATIRISIDGKEYECAAETFMRGKEFDNFVVGVKTESGEWVEIDETKVFLRGEVQ